MPSNLIPIPSNAFSGGAVKLDNSVINRALLQNTWMRQQASQLALDKYFDKQSNQLTGTGMDMQNDGEDFIKLKNAWQEHALQNRRAIVNPSIDGGKAAMQSKALFNEALQFAQKSKEKVRNSQEAYRILSDPNKAALLTEHARDLLHHGTLGLNDPEYVPLDLTNVAFNPKPWSTSDESALSNEIGKYKGSQTSEPPVQDAKTGMQTIRTNTKFGNEDLTGMYGAGSSRYYSNPGFKKMIDDIPKNNPVQFNDLNNLFKQHYGKDIQEGQDLAAAYAISKNPNARSTEKSSAIPAYSAAAQEKKIEMKGIQSGETLARQKEMATFKQGLKQTQTQTDEGKARAYFDNIYNAAKQGQAVSLQSEPDKYWHSLPISEDIKQRFAHKDAVTGKSIVPNDMYVSNDGKTIKPIFYKDPAHQTINKNLSKNITTDEFEQVAGKHQLGLKETNKAPIATKNDPLKLF